MRLGAREVVLGGSVAGLCAAGAVAEYFDEVVVIERSDPPARVYAVKPAAAGS